MTQFLRDEGSDSEEVLTPLMLDGTYLSRNFATLGPFLTLQPPCLAPVVVSQPPRYAPPLRVSVTHLPSALATRSPGRFPPFPLRGECNEGRDETG